MEPKLNTLVPEKQTQKQSQELHMNFIQPKPVQIISSPHANFMNNQICR